MTHADNGDSFDYSLGTDYSRENDILQFAEEITNYILNELRENREEWYFKFQELTPAEQAFLFRALADAFNDSTEN